MYRNQFGLSLIELLVAMLVLGLLATLANAAYSAAAGAGRMAEVQGALHTSILAAQRDAFVRNVEIVLCSSTDGRSCDGKGGWERGWLRFADRNGDRRPQTPEILQSRQGESEAAPIRTSAGRTRLVFQPHGGASAGSNATFVFCDPRGPANARTLVLANSGRLRPGKPSNAQFRAACAAKTEI